MNRLLKGLCSLACLLSSTATFAQHGQYVGGDISMVSAYENAGNVYLDRNGDKINDLVKWFVDECGWNTFRVRIFVNPSMSDAMYQDLDYVKKLGKRIKDAGGLLMLDFHYSDSWADPSKQFIPAAWTDTSDNAIAAKIKDHTETTLKAMKAYGAEPDFVQIGNEISYGMCLRGTKTSNGSTVSADNDKVFPSQSRSQRAAQWDRLCLFLNTAAKAVRDNSTAQIIVHIERAEKADQSVNFFKCIEGVDYDIIGLSYYPFWHGYLPSLAATIDALKTSFPSKKVQIVETAYNFQYSFDSPTYNTATKWPISAAGQYSYMHDLIGELAKHDNVNGLSYWFPEEAGNGDSKTVLKGWVNRGLWWSTKGSNNGHWPVTNGNDDVHHLLRTFLSADAAGITSPVSDASQSTATYSITGQRVDASHKGIVIRNGKKFVIK